LEPSVRVALPSMPQANEKETEIKRNPTKEINNKAFLMMLLLA
jgi:hypothetical protein